MNTTPLAHMGNGHALDNDWPAKDDPRQVGKSKQEKYDPGSRRIRMSAHAGGLLRLVVYGPYFPSPTLN
jgi:hypothetical protein